MEIRDRRGGFLWVNNEIVDDFAPQMGTMALLVYMFLCRHANNDTAVCWPTQERMAQFCQCSSRTIRTSVKELEDMGLVSVQRKKVGDVTKNIYTLLAVDVRAVFGPPPTGNNLPLGAPTGNLTTDQPEATAPLTRLNEQDSLKKLFIRPSIEELRQYCTEIKSKIDPSRWLDYYTANGFRVGKSPMKDWKASVRFWGSNGFSNGGNGDNHKTTAQLRNERIKASINRSLSEVADVPDEPASLFKGIE